MPITFVLQIAALVLSYGISMRVHQEASFQNATNLQQKKIIDFSRQADNEQILVNEMMVIIKLQC